ncbi:MAG: gamma-glutamyl-gamma-aminobutyrate hydrolase family protein [Pseudobdellovibrionaceae bacterium]
MPKHRPLIGVTSPSRSSLPSWYFIRIIIWWAGGRSVRIRPDSPLPKKNLDGLILGGGADIDPTRYKEKVLPALQQVSKEVPSKNWRFFYFVFIWLFRKLLSLEFTTQKEDKQRDELEFHILRLAVEKQIPVLGICRGAQLLNVFFGGSLYQEIAEFYTEQPYLNTVLPKSTILVKTDSRLHSILKKKLTRVNSLHHQSVKTLGQNLKIAAQEPNGVVEAIEHPDFPFLIGVQWHPEFLIPYRAQRRIFKELVEASRKSQSVCLVNVSDDPVSA